LAAQNDSHDCVDVLVEPSPPPGGVVVVVVVHESPVHCVDVVVVDPSGFVTVEGGSE
jgi:hypothetical protein